MHRQVAEIGAIRIPRIRIYFFDSLRRRYRELDISSCASLYGDGETMLSGEALAVEQREFEAWPEITACLQQQRSRLQMRPLRAICEDLETSYDADRGVLELAVSLSAGSYVTVLLSHLLTLREPGRG